MEHKLRCNSLKCRKELDDHAVVTTCSHIFCIECVNLLQLSGQREGRRPVCPACQSQLINPDDVVITNLNPTEDYKTSVLSGLSPQVIIECAGRGLSFWAYQTTQHIIYQEYSFKGLQDKYGSLNVQLDKVINDANSEIANLRGKVSNLELEQDSTRRKNEELNQALREKSRKQMLTQELYDKLKRQALLNQVQSAAIDAVDENIQASVNASRYTDAMQNQTMHPPRPSAFLNAQATGLRLTPSYPTNMGPPHPVRGLGDGNWGARFGGPPGSQNQSMQTPSTHRQQIPAGGNTFAAPMTFPHPEASTISRGPVHPPRASPRQGFAPVTTSTGFSGYGMSAGLKVSNPPGSVVNGMRQRNGLRVAQRPASGVSNHPSPQFGSATNANNNMFSNPGDNYR